VAAGIEAVGRRQRRQGGQGRAPQAGLGARRQVRRRPQAVEQGAGEAAGPTLQGR
jgi:hypothetical protein